MTPGDYPEYSKEAANNLAKFAVKENHEERQKRDIFKDVFFVISCILILLVGVKDIWASMEIMNTIFNVVGMAGGVCIMYWLIYNRKTLGP